VAVFDLTGQVAMVTGGSRGIGAQISLALAGAGADVAVVYRSRQAEADATVAAIGALGRRAVALAQDTGDLDTLDSLVPRAVAALGQVDILVNNAGIAELCPALEVERAAIERVMRVNVTGPFLLAQAVARQLVARGAPGRIVNITSTNGFVGEALLAPYNASKGAMEMLTKSLAIELGPHGVTVNSVAPGLIGTEIGNEFELDKAFWDYAREHVPLHRIGKPEEVAGAVVFLASPAASYITGQHIIVDGGLIADQFPRLQFYTGKP
jgi:NAD(P)-dependent dehydrogenase (short-subunit alcohol dehydrogenase family)